MEMPLRVALREDGSVDPAVDPSLSPEELLFLFRKMLLLRALDEKAISLQRSGRIGFFVPSTGQEASEIGSGFALKEGDWVFPSYRDQGAALVRGYPLSSIVGQLFGNASDPIKGHQMPNHWCDRSINLVSVSSPVATQMPQAVGAGYAAKLRGDKIA
ncbi:MAG: thiamine pyrophosphate-dependent enzyme, partial [Candidatus Deferrimicrobiaceae bacterium]